MSFLGDFRSYLMSRTDAPPDFHIHAGMVTLATALGNRVHTYGWTRDVYANLWAVVIAPSGYGKSTSLDMAEKLLHMAALDERILPGSFSYEALLATLKARPVGTFIIQEFGNFVSTLGRDYNAGSRELLAEIYDAPSTVKRITMKGDSVIKQPCLSILGASSPTWLADSIKGRSVEGGFFERIMFCPSTEVGPMVDDPGPPNTGLEATMADHLRRAATLEGHVDFTDVQKRFSDWQRDQRDRTRKQGEQEFGGMLSRAPLLVKKAAMLLKVSRDPSPPLRVKQRDLDQAVEYVSKSQDKAMVFLRERLAFTPEEGERLKIMDCVRRYGGRVEWSVALKASRLSAYKFKNAIETLRESNRLAVENASAGGPTRSTRFLVDVRLAGGV